MESLKAKLEAKLEAFQRSRVGLFIKKVMDDRAPNLAALLAWGTLSTMLPLLLGILSVAGLILRDPQRLDQIYNTVLVLLPSDAAGPISSALDGVRRDAAAPAGIVAILLLLFNGSSFCHAVKATRYSGRKRRSNISASFALPAALAASHPLNVTMS